MAYTFNQAERQVLTSQGVIEGLKTLVNQHGLSKEVASDYLSGFLGSWTQLQFDEAEKEIQRLQAALSRLKQTARSINKDIKIQASDPRISQLMNDLNALDGWTISLLETNFTIIAFIDPRKAQMKLTQLQSAMSSLMSKRSSDMEPFLKDPSMFKQYFA